MSPKDQIICDMIIKMRGTKLISRSGIHRQMWAWMGNYMSYLIVDMIVDPFFQPTAEFPYTCRWNKHPVSSYVSSLSKIYHFENTGPRWCTCILTTSKIEWRRFDVIMTLLLCRVSAWIHCTWIHALQWRHNARDDVWNHRRFDCYSTVCSEADQRNIKAPRQCPLWGEFTGHRWIPSTKGQ